MEALLSENRTITIDGVDHKVERLGIKHIFQFVRILRAANIVETFAELIKDFQGNGDENQEELQANRIGTALNLIFTLLDAETEIYSLIGKLVNLKATDVESLPPDALVSIIEILIDSPDLKAFFKAVEAVVKKMAPQNPIQVQA